MYANSFLKDQVLMHTDSFLHKIKNNLTNLIQFKLNAIV